MEHSFEPSDDDLEVKEVHYDRIAQDELPSATSLVVVLPESWGDPVETHYAVRRAGPGYTAQAELSSGGFVGLWASPHVGQPDEPVVLYDRSGLRATWQPERLRARVTVGDTSVFVVGDGIEVDQFETVLCSLRALNR
jgi:hypothetical protein